MRRINVRRKLNAMALEFAGKNVLIVDGIYVYFKSCWKFSLEKNNLIFIFMYQIQLLGELLQEKLFRWHVMLVLRKFISRLVLLLSGIGDTHLFSRVIYTILIENLFT